MKTSFWDSQSFVNTTDRKGIISPEPDLAIECKPSDKPSRVMASDLQKKVVACVYSCPDGSIRMSDGIPGLVGTSTDLAIVRTEANRVTIHCLLTSSVESSKENLTDPIKALFDIASAKVRSPALTLDGDPTWIPHYENNGVGFYEDVQGSEIEAVHAGPKWNYRRSFSKARHDFLWTYYQTPPFPR